MFIYLWGYTLMIVHMWRSEVPSTTWLPGIKLRPASPMVDTLTHWGASPALAICSEFWFYSHPDLSLNLMVRVVGGKLCHLQGWGNQTPPLAAFSTGSFSEFPELYSDLERVTRSLQRGNWNPKSLEEVVPQRPQLKCPQRPSTVRSAVPS